jgi:delta(3,5)-delta(2,4)-dienoyl-CoA isomerase
MSWIKHAALTARVFNAQEALRVGLVSEVLPTKDEAVKRGLEIAGLIASKSPVAVQGTKAILDYSVDHAVADGEFLRVCLLL